MQIDAVGLQPRRRARQRAASSSGTRSLRNRSKLKIAFGVAAAFCPSPDRSKLIAPSPALVRRIVFPSKDAKLSSEA